MRLEKDKMSLYTDTLDREDAEQQHYERLADEDHDKKLKDEFNLSDKIVEIEGGQAIHPDDVKEFIGLLKEEIYNMKKLGFITRNNEQDLKTIINKLAGKDLL